MRRRRSPGAMSGCAAESHENPQGVQRLPQAPRKHEMGEATSGLI